MADSERPPERKVGVYDRPKGGATGGGGGRSRLLMMALLVVLVLIAAVLFWPRGEAAAIAGSAAVTIGVTTQPLPERLDRRAA